jgi:beta-glucosidase
VLALGEGSYCETPGNITDLTLGEPQLKLADAIVATGKPVVLVLVEGRPRIINRIADRIPGIVMAYNPSNEGGTAIADVLFGDVNPSGKLPFTYPRTPNGLINYDHKPFETEDTAFGNMAFRPQFAFGDGLSYTTFAYKDLRLDKQTISGNDELGVSVTVSNTGTRAGKEARVRQRSGRLDLTTKSPSATIREGQPRTESEPHVDFQNQARRFVIHRRRQQAHDRARRV